MIYEQMIHELATHFKLCKFHVANNYKETDFWEMLCFENNKNEFMNYRMKKNEN